MSVTMCVEILNLNCFQLQPVDLASVSDVKARFAEECGDVITSSPIVQMVFPSATLNRPISIIVPIPANASKPKRPMTASVDKERAKGTSRPASAFGLGSYSREDGLSIMISLCDEIEPEIYGYL